MLQTSEPNLSTPTFPVEHAVRHICAQHRNLARVFRAMETQLQYLHTQRDAADFNLIDAMLRYVEDFTGRIHHPTEERFLLTAMRRAGVAADLIEKVSNAHSAGLHKLKTLRGAFDLSRKYPQYAQAFVQAAADYLAFEFDHMYEEESVILPCAVDALPASDWPPVAAAFLAHEDPLFGDRPDPAFAPLLRHLK